MSREPAPRRVSIVDGEDELLHWLVRRRPGGDAYKMVRLHASGKTSLIECTVPTYREVTPTYDLNEHRRPMPGSNGPGSRQTGALA